MTRRDFLATTAGAAAGLSSGALFAQETPPQAAQMFWGYLVHLGFNMWGDREAPKTPENWAAKPFLRFDMSLWNDLLPKMHDAGVTTVVIDLAEGVRYKSHPELAVKDAWTPEKLKEELARVRSLGMQPIPKLNFSTAHDLWLGPYARQVSTDAYYRVCADLIAEVIALFDKPPLFHLGMDEETYENQKTYEYVVVRQYDLWWHDIEFLFAELAKQSVRPWMWSDYCWRHPDDFFTRMPKSVLQSSYFYEAEINASDEAVEAYLNLEAHDFEQAPTGSNWISPLNFENTVTWCMDHISSRNLKGFLQTSWRPTLEAYRQQHMEALDQLAKARVKYAQKKSMPTQA
jgi:hypothetical protein